MEGREDRGDDCAFHVSFWWVPGLEVLLLACCAYRGLPSKHRGSICIGRSERRINLSGTIFVGVSPRGVSRARHIQKRDTHSRRTPLYRDRPTPAAQKQTSTIPAPRGAPARRAHFTPLPFSNDGKPGEQEYNTITTIEHGA